MKIAVVGLGKIGLPLAVQYATKGHEVVGIDINAETVNTINEGRAPFPGEARLEEYLSVLTPAKTLQATTNYADAIPDSDVVVVVVPLFVDAAGAPEFGMMDAATRDIASNLTVGTLVIYETTLPVGTTRQRWKPMLEAGSGLSEGEHFHVAFSPERVLTGRVFQDLKRYPKLVGGLSVEGSSAAASFYEQTLDFDQRLDLARVNGVWDLGSAEAAELVKLAETTYRDVNIGLANQFATFAERSGINVYDVIDAANSQPFSHIHRPGISVGGHCIPIYPQLYLANHPDATVVRAAREANATMPAHAVELLDLATGPLSQMRVAVLGAAYRGGVKETAFSGVFDLTQELLLRGAVPLVHDPMYSDAELGSMNLVPYHLGTPIDAVVLHTDHEAYRSLRPEDIPGAKCILDGRAMLTRATFPDAMVVRIGDGSIKQHR